MTIKRRKSVSVPKKPPEPKPLWQCPKCGKHFITRNMWHSCKLYRAEPLFARCEPHVLQLYKKLETMVLACGPVIIEPKRTGIAFQVRVRALGCVPRKSYLKVGFAFAEQRQHPRFQKVKTYSPHWYTHWIHVRSEQELDGEVEAWIRDAYARAAQKHRSNEDGNVAR